MLWQNGQTAIYIHLFTFYLTFLRHLFPFSPVSPIYIYIFFIFSVFLTLLEEKLTKVGLASVLAYS